MIVDNIAHGSDTDSSNESGPSSHISDLGAGFSTRTFAAQDFNSVTDNLNQVSRTGVDDHLWGYLVPFQCHDGRSRLDFWRATPCVTIGRDDDNTIRLLDPKISTHHCVISWDGSESEVGVVVNDFSLNGTWINGSIIGVGRMCVLKDGNEISFGNPVSQRGNNLNETYRYIYRRVLLPVPRTGIHVRYEVMPESLGQGSFGIVRLACDRTTGVRYAVKIIEKKKEMGNMNRKIMNNLAREIWIMQNLVHRNICRLHDYFISDELTKFCFSLVLEYVDGGNLKTYIDIKHRNGLMEAEAMNIVYQICDAMVYVHSEGITHRDLKPENILITKGNPPMVKIADFGLSKDTNGMSELHSVCGTLTYVAPEVTQSGFYDNKVDSFSLGAILYFMLTGREAFTVPHSSEMQQLAKVDGALRLARAVNIRMLGLERMHCEHISENARDLVERLLKEDPRERPSMRDVLNHPWLVNYKPVYESSNSETNQEANEEHDEGHDADETLHAPQDAPSGSATSDPHTPRTKGKARMAAKTPGSARGRARARISAVRAPRQRAPLSPVREAFGTDADGDSDMSSATPARRARRVNQQSSALGRGMREKKPTWKVMQMGK